MWRFLKLTFYAGWIFQSSIVVFAMQEGVGVSTGMLSFQRDAQNVRLLYMPLFIGAQFEWSHSLHLKSEFNYVPQLLTHHSRLAVWHAFEGKVLWAPTKLYLGAGLLFAILPMQPLLKIDFGYSILRGSLGVYPGGPWAVTAGIYYSFNII